MLPRSRLGNLQDAQIQKGTDGHGSCNLGNITFFIPQGTRPSNIELLGRVPEKFISN